MPGRESATVTAVIDGDTIRVRLAGGAVETVRYIGVDTPETREPGTPVQCYGPEATARNTALVVAERSINVVRRGDDGIWRYAISLLSPGGPTSNEQGPQELREEQ